MSGIGSLINTRINLLAIGNPSLIAEYRDPLMKQGTEPNIYMFHKVDRISFVNNECIVKKEKVILKIKNESKNYQLTFDLTDYFAQLFYNKVYFDGKYEFQSSNKRIKLLLTNENFVAMDAINIMTSYEFYKYVQEKEEYLNKDPLSLDTIYVGMAYGDGGSRNAFDRISNHTKLQQILSEAFDEKWEKDIIVSLWEVQASIVTGMIGSYDSVEEDIEHIENIFSGPIDQKQIVNLTEAGVIYHLQPPYNKVLKKVFPDKNTKSYSEIYFRKFDGISIEFGLEYQYVTIVSNDVIITEQNPYIEVKWLGINEKEFFKKMVDS